MLFFVANLVLLSTYKLRYSGQVQSLDERLHQQESRRKDLDKQREELLGMLNQLQVNDAAVHQLYDERFSTRRRRLVGVSAEVQEMAAKAGLQPKAISFPEEEIQDYDLIKRSYVFTVQGTYANLRRFVQQLELSRSFITLEEIAVTGDPDGPGLRMDLALSTLFARDPADPGSPASSATAGSARGGTQP
jgi:Tfp pilus assembly protein PilO